MKLNRVTKLNSFMSFYLRIFRCQTKTDCMLLLLVLCVTAFIVQDHFMTVAFDADVGQAYHDLPPVPPPMTDREVYLEQRRSRLHPHGQPRVVNGVQDILSMKPPSFDPLYKNPCWHTNGTLKCLPYFHIIGVCKSGTTDMFARILRHPHVLPSGGFNGKETHWWSWRRFRYDVFHNQGRLMNYTEYVNTFDKPAREIQAHPLNTSAPHKYHYITGEGSPTTFWDLSGWRLIPQNTGPTPIYTTPHCVYHLQPQQKLMLMLRNPTERLYSDYLFLYNPANKSADDFHNRVKDEIHRFRQCEARMGRRMCIMDREMHTNAKVRLLVNFYADYLAEWMQVFPPEQLLVMRTEDYGKDVMGHMTKVFRFLGLEPLPESTMKEISASNRSFQRSNKDKTLGTMRDDTRTMLDAFYEPYNRELARILNDSSYTWKQ